jgi:hypothetical protein
MNRQGDKKFCFIVGSPRSGTTFLNRILKAHDQVIGGPETHLFSILEKLIKHYDYIERRGSLQNGLHHWVDRAEFYNKCADFFVDLTFANVDGFDKHRVYLEKSPQHVFCLETIGKLFSDYLIIHLIRDPVEVCDSLMRAAKSWGESWAPKSLKRTFKLWSGSVDSGCQTGRRLGDRYLEIYYHDLLANPAAVAAELFSRLGLECPTELLESCVSSVIEPVDLPRGFVRQPSDPPALTLLARTYVRLKSRRVIKKHSLSL